MTIGGVPPNCHKPWFINPGLRLLGMCFCLFWPSQLPVNLFRSSVNRRVDAVSKPHHAIKNFREIWLMYMLMYAYVSLDLALCE